MEYEVVKKWLDELVYIHITATKEQVFASNIRASITNDLWVMFYEGIESVAKVMGLELEESILHNDARIWFSYSFVYNGVKFVEYKSKRLESYGDTE